MTQPQIIHLPKIADPRGNLTFVEDHNQIPFEIKRVYWTYDVPAGESRGGHSHRKLEQLLVAVSGSIAVQLTDGYHLLDFTLNRPYEGLYIPPGWWRTLHDFTSGSALLCIVSDIYDEADYVRDFDEFKKIALERGPLI